MLDQTAMSVESNVEINVEMSGRINCTACNRFGCDSVEQDILVSGK
jgi:hypothetical protein